MKAIGLTGNENENQAIVAAQLLDRFTQRGLAISVCIGIVTIEHANVIHMGGGELWLVGAHHARPHLQAHVDREIDTSCDFAKTINLVDQAIGLFLGKTQVAA